MATATQPKANTAAQIPIESATPGPWSIVGLGDSVTSAYNCNCTGFIELYGARLAKQSNVKTVTHNFGQPGETSAGLYESLRTNPSLQSYVARANIVVVTIGANDFTYAPSGCSRLACYQSGLAALRTNMTAILNTVRTLRRGSPTMILVTGYWEVWEDGAVGRSMGSRFMSVDDALTSRVNAAISAAAAQSSSARFVDLYVPFRGASGDADDTSLLAADGDHPSAAGHRVIAEALLAAGTAPLA